MWTATIESKTFSKGILQVGVVYTNGNESFTEPYVISSEEEINGRITNRLSTLEKLEGVSISLGAFTPQLVTSDENPKQEKLNELRKIKELVSLGVLKDTDQQVLDAIEAVKENQ